MNFIAANRKANHQRASAQMKAMQPTVVTQSRLRRMHRAKLRDEYFRQMRDAILGFPNAQASPWGIAIIEEVFNAG